MADRNNNRVLMLDKELRLKRILLDGKEMNFGYPFRMCIDSEAGRLLVAISNGQVAVYKTRAKLARLV